MALRKATQEEIGVIKGVSTTPVSATQQPVVSSQKYSKLRPVSVADIQRISDTQNTKSSAVEKQKQERVAQGLPVSVRNDRATPTIGGSILRAPLKLAGTIASTILPASRTIAGEEDVYKPLKTEYLGDVYSPGGKAIRAIDQGTFIDPNKSIGQNIGRAIGQAGKATLGVAGTGAEAASYVVGGGALPQLGKQSLLKFAGQEALAGGLGGFGAGTEQAQDATTVGQAVGDIAKNTAIGTGIGLAGGGLLGLGGAGTRQLGKLVSETGRTKIVQNTVNKGVDELFNKTRSITNKVNEITNRKNVDLKGIVSDPNIYRGIKVVDTKIDPTDAIGTLDNRIDSAMDAKSRLLPELDAKVPPISKQKIREKALAEIRGTSTPKIEDDLVRAIDAELSVLPDTLKPSEADALRARFRKASRDAKGMQKSNSEYSAIENALRDSVFDVTDNLPFDTSGEYAQLNKFIKDMIETKDFLDKTVRGQVVKGGRLQSLAARGIGALAGSKGGILTTLLGSEIGGAVSNIILNNQLGSSLKLKLIREIVDDPAILKQIESMLVDTKKYNPILQLPEGVSKNPVVTSPILLRGPNVIEKQSPNIRRNTDASLRYPDRKILQLPGIGQSSFKDFILPQSIRDTNQGLDELKNAYIKNVYDRRKYFSKPKNKK